MLARTYNPQQVEDGVEEFWKEHGVKEKTIGYDASRPMFSFVEGPPTANAPPALHHVEMRTFKDAVCRYRYMRGFTVPRKGGWDCHGLPVEVQIEKKLGLKTKKDVLAYGIGAFNQLCRQDVFTYIDAWNKLTEKLAFWIDLEHPYVTLDNNYIESVWWSLKELHNKQLLYESHKVVPYCPRCETPLSSHEVAQGYQEADDPSIVVKFRLKNTERHFLAWTTTPWTTPSNVGLAVNRNMAYVVVEQDNQQYVLAKDAVPRHFREARVVEELTGEKLIGLEYEPLFDYFIGKLDKPAWKVIAADFVTAEEGTGIVHQSPAFGEDDYNACRDAGLAFVQPVGEDGRFTADVPELHGLFFKEADAKIVEKLEREGKLFRKGRHSHNYPFCWRCKTPLLYYAITSWFISTTAKKKELLANNEKIQWYPEHIKHGRFGDWLNNVKDWALSRKKFWGTPLPVWRCESCGKDSVIGSVAELKEKATDDLGSIDLHKPAIDGVKLRCTCGADMLRVSDVIDCWYDSGAAPFAQYHYPFENRDLFAKSFPYAYIAEAIDQTRGWFYTLHALGTLLFDSPAYLSVVSAGHIVDENGEKMSKSRGNVIDPWLAFEKVGVDAVRLQFCTSAPGSQKRFGFDMVREAVSPFLTTLWNTAAFAEKLVAQQTEEPELQKEDTWLRSRTNALIADVTAHFEQHDYHLCFSAMKDYVDLELSKWYIRLTRDRALAGDAAVRETLRYAFSSLLRLLAPLAPYVTEHLWQELHLSKRSVHCEPWPEAGTRDENVEQLMTVTRDITQSLLALREKTQRGVRWPLGNARIVTRSETTRQAVRNFAQLIKTQCNLKKLTLTDHFAEATEKVTLNAAKISEDFGETASVLLSTLATQNPAAIYERVEAEGRYTTNVQGTPASLRREHFTVTAEPPDNQFFAVFGSGRIYLDTTITPELEEEGYQREFVRRIQQFRKNSGLQREDVIALTVRVPAELLATLSGIDRETKQRIGVSELRITEEAPQGDVDLKETMKIKGHQLEFFGRKKAP